MSLPVWGGLVGALVAVAVAVLAAGRWVRAGSARHRLGATRRSATGNRAVADRYGRAPRRFVSLLEAMAVTAEPLRLWWQLLLGAVAVVGGAAVLAGPAIAAVVVLAGAVLAGMTVDLHRDRADRLVDAGLPAVLDRIAAGLRAGLGLSVALHESVPATVGPLRGDLVALTASLDAGVALGDGLTRWRHRRPTPGTRLVTAALTLCSVTGGRSRPLDGVAATLRDHLAVEREIRAVSAQIRASALVLVAMPWVFVGFSVAQDPDVVGFFTDSPLGWACLVGGVLLDGAGAWLMSRTIRSVR